MSKNAVLLARVSTKMQGENYSLPSQLAAMRTYCSRNDLQVIDEITDTFTGNSAVIDRPGGAKVYEHLRRKSAQAVVLYTLDRTARDDDTLEYAIFKRDVKRAGAELHFADMGKVSDDLYGGLMEQFKAVGATEERKKIAERMQRGRLAKVKGDGVRPGRWAGNGQPPYGYKRVGKGKTAELQIEKNEALIVRRIYAMYVGQNAYLPMNMDKIAAALTAENIPSPKRGPKSSKGWWRESVRLILISPRYLGEFHYGEQVAHLPELAIIDRETWEEAQVRRKKNSQTAKRNRKHDYLLAGGYQRCTCGYSMVGTASNYNNGNPDKLKHVLYYVCSSERQLGECHEGKIRAEEVDALVWNWLSSLLKDETLLDAGIKRMAERQEIELSPKRARLAVVLELLEETAGAVKNLTKALGRAKSDLVADAIQNDLDQVEKHVTNLTDERDLLQAYIGQDTLTPDEIATIKAIAAELRDELTDPDYSTRRYIIDRLNLRSQLWSDETGRWLEVTCGISPEPDPAKLSIRTRRSNACCATSSRTLSCRKASNARQALAGARMNIDDRTRAPFVLGHGSGPRL